MDSNNNNKFGIKLEDNNPPSFQAEGSLTKSKEDINNQNMKKNEDENKVIQIIIHSNNKSDKKESSGNNKNTKDISSIRDLNKFHQLNKTNVEENDLNLDLDVEFSVKNKSPSFLKKVYGILSIQFIFILGLVLIFQIKRIKNYIKNHPNFFWAFLAISLFVLIIIIILFLCGGISKEAPCNYIAIIVLSSSFGLLFAVIGAYTNFYVILGIITCMLSIFAASLIFVLLYKGDESKCCHFFVISFIALLIHFGIVALIFKDHYIIFLCDTAGVLLYSVYIDFDILTIIEKYDVDEYTLASIRLTLDTFGMFSVLTSGNSTSRRARRRHYGKRFHGFRF